MVTKEEYEELKSLINKLIIEVNDLRLEMTNKLNAMNKYYSIILNNELNKEEK